MLRKVVILAAGRGTRLLPVTSVVAKELLPIIDTPVIEYVLREALIPSIEEVILVTSWQKTSLVEYLAAGSSSILKDRLARISLRVIYQEDRTADYGTGAGLLSAAEEIGTDPFLLIFADSFGLEEDERIENMTRLFEESGAPVVSLIPIKREQMQMYGIPKIIRQDNGRMRIFGILEKPEYSPELELLATPGAFILKPDIFPFVEKVARDASGEVPFTNALSDYCQEHEVLGQVFTGKFFEAGNRADVAKSVLEMSLLRDDTRRGVLMLLKNLR